MISPTNRITPQNTYLFLCIVYSYEGVIVALSFAVQRASVLLSDTTAKIAKKSDWGMFKPTLFTKLGRGGIFCS